MSLPNRFLRPHRVRPRSLGAGPMPTIAVRAIEVVQSIQRVDNSIPLVADKPTVVRLYVDPNSVSSSVPVAAELAWRREGGERYLPVFGEVRLDPSAGVSLEDQRRGLGLSFNVDLPPEATAAGCTTLRLSRLRLAGGDDFRLDHDDPAMSTTVTFVEVPPLRIRAVGLRYQHQGTTFTPEARHFRYLRSYLARAYPTARVEWSQVVVNANFNPPFEPGTSLLANAQLAALRSREVSLGVDPRTHYIGLVDDGNGLHFMRGRASGIPGAAAPDTVCSTPVGRPGGFAGDHDDSYADWYGAHELGHTFGRFHPGFPAGSQGMDDPSFPYPGGLISGTTDTVVGFDMGDPALGLPRRVLDGQRHHDVMTYAERQWVSDYTFNAILARLISEDALV